MTWVEIGTVGAMLVTIIAIIIGSQRYNESKRSKIYMRLDNVKEGFETRMSKDYSRKDLCEYKHNQIEKELKEIKAQTSLIPEMAAQIKVLTEKVN